MRNKEHLLPFKDGFDSRRNLQGRPPKLINAINKELKDAGYDVVTYNDMIDAVKLMINLPHDELHRISVQETNYPMLYRIIARDLINERKRSEYLEKLLDRAFGRSQQKMDITSDDEQITIQFINSNDTDKSTDRHKTKGN